MTNPVGRPVFGFVAGRALPGPGTNTPSFQAETRMVTRVCSALDALKTSRRDDAVMTRSCPFSIGGVTEPPPGHATRFRRFLIRLFTATFTACVAALIPAAAAYTASLSTLHHREHRQVRSLHQRLGTVRFFRRHPWLAHTAPGRRALHVARVWIPILRRELAETRAQLHPQPRTPWPAWWYGQAMCIHSHEGAWNDNTGNGYFGGMQFLESTWSGVAGAHDDAFDHPGDQTNHPFAASPVEQLYRAWLVWRRDGQSWAEWGTRGLCNL